jgi:hypothetical protein
MKIVRSLIRASAAVACGALVLSVLAGDAMAGKKPQPPVSLFWPNGANLYVSYYSGNFGGLGQSLLVGWPVASGADHYRLKVVVKIRQDWWVVSDENPAEHLIDPNDGWLYDRFNFMGGGSYSITLTAYSEPDEAAAYSESLQAQINAH